MPNRARSAHTSPTLGDKRPLDASVEFRRKRGPQAVPQAADDELVGVPHRSCEPLIPVDRMTPRGNDEAPAGLVEALVYTT